MLETMFFSLINTQVHTFSDSYQEASSFKMVDVSFSTQNSQESNLLKFLTKGKFSGVPLDKCLSPPGDCAL